MQGEVLESERGHTFLHGENVLHSEMKSTEYSAIPQWKWNEWEQAFAPLEFLLPFILGVAAHSAAHRSKIWETPDPDG